MTSVIIYSKNNCIYCKKAKGFLNELNISYMEILLDKENDLINYTSTVQELKQKYNHSTFPFIIINDVFIGGYMDLENAYNTNYLHKLLNLNIECNF